MFTRNCLYINRVRKDIYFAVIDGPYVFVCVNVRGERKLAHSIDEIADIRDIFHAFDKRLQRKLVSLIM